MSIILLIVISLLGGIILGVIITLLFKWCTSFEAKTYHFKSDINRFSHQYDFENDIMPSIDGQSAGEKFKEENK